MNVLQNMLGAVCPQGVVLDLQVVQPNPRVELESELICEIDGSALFAKADAAANAIDVAIADGQLIELAVDDHDVLSHYPNGRDLIADFEDSVRDLPTDAIPRLEAIQRPLAIRERCRLRRLEVQPIRPA